MRVFESLIDAAFNLVSFFSKPSRMSDRSEDEVTPSQGPSNGSDVGTTTAGCPLCENCGEEVHPNVPCSYVGGVDQREAPRPSDELAVDDSEQLTTTARTAGVESGDATVGLFEDQPVRVPEQSSDSSSSGTSLGLTLVHLLDHEPQEVSFVITKDMIAEGNRLARERATEAVRNMGPGSHVRPERQRNQPIPSERQQANIIISEIPTIPTTTWSPPISKAEIPRSRPNRWSILKNKAEIEGFDENSEDDRS